MEQASIQMEQQGGRFTLASKDGSSETFYMLVNFEYFFLGKSFGLKFLPNMLLT